ncbi:MAG: hypothetical protein PWQ18_936 [Clostridia bacterium]|nr:hypothetical protein [Clostridia bacterium]
MNDQEWTEIHLAEVFQRVKEPSTLHPTGNAGLLCLGRGKVNPAGLLKFGRPAIAGKSSSSLLFRPGFSSLV